MTNEPAFPCECDFRTDGTIEGHRTELRAGIVTGLSKREYFASAALSGLASSGKYGDDCFADKDWSDLLSDLAVKLADALIERLNSSE